MRVFALADLHLSGSVNKPMDVFGPTWDNHLARIREAWLETVGEEDLVLIPGDVSWAMHLAEAKTDLCTIASFPGKKLILRGNHDYWWNSLAKVRGALPEGMYALQNDAFVFGDVAIAGSRGCARAALGSMRPQTARFMSARSSAWGFLFPARRRTNFCFA